MTRVQMIERRQLNELELKRHIANIRGLCEYLGLGSYQINRENGDIEVGNGGKTLLKAEYKRKVSGEETWLVEEIKFYPENDPFVNLYSAMKEFQKKAKPDPEKYRCSGYMVCENRDCMSYNSHEFNIGIDGVQFCPLTGFVVKGIEYDEICGHFSLIKH